MQASATCDIWVFLVDVTVVLVKIHANFKKTLNMLPRVYEW